jgi:predicted O-methyltransferase YrrM
MYGKLLSSGCSARQIRRRAGRAWVWLRANTPHGRFLGIWGLWLLRQAYGDRPVPIGVVSTLWALLGKPDALALGGRSTAESGRLLRNAFLSSRIANTELGVWGLAVSTLDFLEREIRSRRPRRVLEFGSGTSTACLCRYMQELHGNSSREYVTSVEQDLGVAKRTHELLKALDLGANARIVHSPLREQTIEGHDTACYDISDAVLKALASEAPPDFVVIDGPAAKPGQRFGTLPLVESVLKPGARFFLDDALRMGEIEVGRLWSRRPHVRVDGIHLFGKGLLVGQFTGKPSAPRMCR